MTPVGAAALSALALFGCATAQATAHARVAIRCDDPGAELSVDGVPRGTAGDYANGHRLLLAPGVHQVELRGHGAVEVRALRVGPEDDLTLNIALGQGARAAAQGEHP